VSDWEERTRLDDLAEEQRTIEPQDFRVTFGQRYRREEHPRWPLAHPDGWLTIAAPSYEVARAWVIRELGTSWCDIYAPRSFERSLYELGELGRFGVDDSLLVGVVVGGEQPAAAGDDAGADLRAEVDEARRRGELDVEPPDPSEYRDLGGGR